jgi:hypothetical protein
MKKDAYYFPHFSNARNDAKLIKLRRVMGIEGYGMYFLLLEVLREQTDFKLPLNTLEDLAYEWHTSKEKLLTVIANFELFEIVEDYFFSIKLVHYLQPYLEKSERARQAALTRWENTKAMQMHTNSDANALQMQCDGNASKGEETKLNETKEKDYYEKSFLKFWDLYNKKIDKKKCFAKWKRLKDEEIEKIFKTLPDYIKSTPDITYRKNPLTYLNSETWEDEIIIHEPTQDKDAFHEFKKAAGIL